MRKLYLATKTVNAMFIRDEHDKGSSLETHAMHFLNEEENNHARGKSYLQIKEITSLDQVPLEWAGNNLLWGCEEEITPTAWLANKKAEEQKEFQEYLRLKAKFESFPPNKDIDNINPSPGYYDGDWFRR